jgi:hypothetical protein
MSKLTAKQRANLPPKAFGLPEKARTEQARRETGNYPMPDRGHAISALRLSELEYERGKLTKDQYDRIQRKARKKLRKKKKTEKKRKSKQKS